MEQNGINENVPQQPVPVVADTGMYSQTVRGSGPVERLWVIPLVLTLLALSVTAAAWLGMNL